MVDEKRNELSTVVQRPLEAAADGVEVHLGDVSDAVEPPNLISRCWECLKSLVRL